MGKGKMAAQAAHASIGAAGKTRKSVLKKWSDGSSKKVVLKVDGLRKLKAIHKKAKNSKLPVFLVRDAGMTQIKSGTITCLGLGPAEEKKIDKITSDLKLL